MNASIRQDNLLKLSISAGLGSILFLILLHFLSPEFAPSWRMVSEYATGNYKWALSSFFVLWGLHSCALAVYLWKLSYSKKMKIGVVLFFISGVREIAASFFDVNHSLHGVAGLLGVPTLPVAALLISYQLANRETWATVRKEIMYSAHFYMDKFGCNGYYHDCDDDRIYQLRYRILSE